MSENKANAISVSLMNRKIYAVCFTGLDPLASFHDALHNARRLYFEHGKTVHIRENGIYSGLAGEVRGKLTRRSFKWKKKAGGRVAEISFVRGSQHGIEFFDMNGALHARIYLDRDHHWLRSEYFSPDDSARAKLCFKPDDTRDAVIRFDYNYSTGKTKETMLFPVPYAYQTAEQSLQNASCGDEFLLIADSTGEAIYCPRDEQQRRIRFLKNNKDASVMLSMGWEVRDGDISAPALPDADESTPSEEKNPMMAMLDELFDDVHRETEAALAAVNRHGAEMPAEEPGEAPAAEASAGESTERSTPECETVENTPEAAEPIPEPVGDTTEEPGAAPAPTDEPHIEAAPASGIAVIRNGAEIRYRGGLENGLRDGFGRTESETGVTLYEGEYKNDLRDGFGAHHYKSGAVSYIGDFKDDKRDGFGVSFRENDHALHVSRWTDGKPEGYAALFDPNGAMRFAGKIIDGKKQGAGVSIDTEKDTVFVAKFEDNEMTGEGALFAGDGTLLYVGGWENGRRNGRGTEFDKAGDVVYSGEWKDDRYQNGILYKRVQPGENA